jgi:hypothetical protein
MHLGEVPAGLGQDVFLDLPDGVADVADHLVLREVDGIDLGRAEVDVDHLGAAAA